MTMTVTESIFHIFEGICPTCEAETEVVEAGGTQEFIEDFAGDLPPEACSYWQPRNGVDGNLHFKCRNGHTHTVAHYMKSGDWNL